MSEIKQSSWPGDAAPPHSLGIWLAPDPIPLSFSCSGLCVCHVPTWVPSVCLPPPALRLCGPSAATPFLTLQASCYEVQLSCPLSRSLLPQFHASLAGHGSPARPPDTSPGCRLSSDLFLPPNEDLGKETSSEIWNQWLRKPSQESHFPAE